LVIDETAWRNTQENFIKPTPELERARLQQAVEHIYLPRRAPESVAHGALTELYDVVTRTVGGKTAVLYLEFGVAGGKSMRRIAERFPNPNSKFVGFDSFEGIPEDWKDKPRGSFSMKGKPPLMTDRRVSFVKGWFQNTLPVFLAALDRTQENPVLVHYDADLYSSTLFILSTLWFHIPEYYFMFDEFMSEEIIALHDFSLAFPVNLQFLCQTNAGGSPSQVFGKLRRVNSHYEI